MAGSAVLSCARMSPLCSGRTLEEGFSEVLRNPQMPVSTLLGANKGTLQAGRLRRGTGYESQASGHPWLQGTLSFLSSSFPAHSLSSTSSTPSFPATTVGISQDVFSTAASVAAHPWRRAYFLLCL